MLCHTLMWGLATRATKTEPRREGADVAISDVRSLTVAALIGQTEPEILAVTQH